MKLEIDNVFGYAPELVRVLLAGSMLLSLPAGAEEQIDPDEMHPLMTDKYWVNLGGFFAARDFDATVTGSVGDVRKRFDFESAMGLDDKPDLFITEFGWQFGKEWGLSLQYFRSERSSEVSLQETIEWDDLVFDVGIDIAATSKITVTRLFLSRRFWDGGRHSIRLGGGVHFLEAAGSIAGEARLDDETTEYRNESVSASFPVPNIGAWYRYSPSDRWLFNVRADWFSASLDDFAGGIWNAAAGANLRITDHFGVGLSYQFFEIDGELKETHWRGTIRTRFTGPSAYIMGYW